MACQKYANKVGLMHESKGTYWQSPIFIIVSPYLLPYRMLSEKDELNREIGR